MNAVGIDVSKGHSTVAILRPLGEVVAMPFHVPHTSQGVLQLATLLRGLSGETKIIMECTGSYFQPLALSLHHEGFFVSALHAQLIHDFGNNTIRRVKTDKQGSPHLRKTLFLIMNCILQKAPPDHPVFQFLDRKRAQGKHYYNYMTAGSAKFLRIYYARVMEYLVALDS